MKAAVPDWLVADIGGTHARFALSAAGAPPRASQTLACADFPGPEAALDAYLDQTGAHPVAACLAVAGPVEGDQVRLTNNPWTLSRQALCMRFGFKRLLLINDFEALALALPGLTPADTMPIGPALAVPPDRVLSVLGPGTGLGVALLAPVGGGWLVLPGEGGHAGFAPQDDLERAVCAFLLRTRTRVSNEDILSGPGLAALYQALAEIDGAGAESLAAAEITARALAGSDARAARVVDLFCAVLGAVAGDVALVAGARGGVYIGGGIAPRVAQFLARSRFRQRFEDKGLQHDYMTRIPTRLIVAPQPALLGACAALRAAPGAAG